MDCFTSAWESPAYRNLRSVVEMFAFSGCWLFLSDGFGHYNGLWCNLCRWYSTRPTTKNLGHDCSHSLVTIIMCLILHLKIQWITEYSLQGFFTSKIWSLSFIAYCTQNIIQVRSQVMNCSKWQIKGDFISCFSIVTLLWLNLDIEN